MSTPPIRTRLSPVWLTATERLLVRSLMDVLIDEIQGSTSAGAIAAFARACPIQAIEETAALFHDKAAPTNEGTS